MMHRRVSRSTSARRPVISSTGAAPPELMDMARRPYDAVVLCEADFDFVQDGCRRDEGFRNAQQAWTLAQLHEMGVACLRVHGSPAEEERPLVRRS